MTTKTRNLRKKAFTSGRSDTGFLAEARADLASMLGWHTGFAHSSFLPADGLLSDQRGMERRKFDNCLPTRPVFNQNSLPIAEGRYVEPQMNAPFLPPFQISLGQQELIAWMDQRCVVLEARGDEFHNPSSGRLNRRCRFGANHG